MVTCITKQIADDIFMTANEVYQNSLKKPMAYRWGQVLWNTALDFIEGNGSEELKVAFHNLCSTDADCFYNDQNTAAFMDALTLLRG